MVRVSKRWVAMVGAFWALGVGCSGGSSGNDEPEAEPPIAQDDYVQALHDAMCEGLGPCCVAEALPYDRETCLAAPALGVLPSELDPAVAYDGVAARHCLESFKARLAACEPYDADKPDAGCDGIFQPTLELGRACKSAEACISGICDSVTATCVGEPAPFARVAEGQPCDSECYGLKKGGYSCGLPRGGATTSVGGCYFDDGLFCRFEQAEGPGVCRRFPVLGEACVTQNCKDGYCDWDTMVCVPQQTSGACSSLEMCGGGTTCVGLASETMGQCLPPQADGEPCTRPSDCQNGKCEAGTAAERRCGKGPVATAETCAGIW